MTAAVPGARGIKADCITDGACTESSTYFQKSSNAATGSPYMFTIDMQKEAVISEINLSTRLVNGSEAAYKYTIEGSRDGKSYKMLVDGKLNWQVGFLILNIEIRRSTDIYGSAYTVLSMYIKTILQCGQMAFMNLLLTENHNK